MKLDHQIYENNKFFFFLNLVLLQRIQLNNRTAVVLVVYGLNS